MAYKEGTYKKVWNGKEDNVVMLSFLEESVPTATGFIQTA